MEIAQYRIDLTDIFDQRDRNCCIGQKVVLIIIDTISSSCLRKNVHARDRQRKNNDDYGAAVKLRFGRGNRFGRFVKYDVRIQRLSATIRT
jgi:hypothetical protein